MTVGSNSAAGSTNRNPLGTFRGGFCSVRSRLTSSSPASRCSCSWASSSFRIRRPWSSLL